MAQELALDMARLVDLARHVVRGHGSVVVVVFPTDSALSNAHQELQRLLGASRFAARVVSIPGFVQAGVFRYESARKAIAQRVSSLFAVLQGETRVVLTSVRGIGRFVPSPSWVASHGMRLVAGEDLELEKFVGRLQKIGYLEVPAVEEVGDYAVRGGIVDLWIPGRPSPSRVEIFGDQVDEIRSFRPSDGRSYRSDSEIVVLPCREFDWPADDELEQAIERLNAVTFSQRLPGQARADLFENMRQSVPFLGIDDAALSLFSDRFSKVRTDVFGDDGRYTTLLRYIDEVLKPRGLPWRVCLSGAPAELDGQLNEDLQLYSRASVTARHKGFLHTPAHAVFCGWLLAAHQADEPSGPLSFVDALGVPVDSSAVSPHLSADLQRVLQSESCRKAKGRLEALAEVLGCGSRAPDSSLGVRRIWVGLRSQATLPEVRGFLSAVFPALAGDVPSETLSAEGSDALCAGGGWVGRAEDGYALPQHFFIAPAASPVDVATAPEFFVGDLHAPIFAQDAGILVVSESWLRGSSHGAVGSDLPVAVEGEDGGMAATSRSNAEILMQAQFSEFREGDLVVHIQHGIGRFLGLATVKVAEASGDFLVIEYAGKDKIYVPVDKLNFVQRYIGQDAGAVTLDSLVTQTWDKKRERARKDAERLARQMLEHQARRAAAGGHAFGRHDEDVINFEAAFPFDETPDQLKSVREIALDMGSEKAMDRLLCGDVGFGKTEVAMRAAYRAVLDGLQVAWLVPTTVLAHQHYRSAEERFKSFGVRVALLDRGQGAKAQRLTLEALAAGQIDVLIGTHRILSTDVVFRNLGLLVVDEEQRFGVTQKERIKNMAYGVDVLTMTATPIPRTLQMAMLGLRDLSLLTTPPKSRLAVKTLVCPFDDETIKFAIETELARGGQVFYVHNRVEELDALKVFLQKIVPQARIAMGHGQMPQKELDQTIIDFLDGRFDVLLCTTIIESGIDMPNVNTILVQNADCFGLAQLYQLRGRVGRRSARGYSYFLLSPGVTENDEGYKRIEILREHQALGSGFVIASHDLEMRGGGQVLGDDQSGHMTEVGLETYNQMLDEAMQTLGGVRASRLKDVDVKLPVDVNIPESYIQSSQERLRYYRRFFSAGTEDALRSLVDECADRFGAVPVEVQRLAALARIKRLAAGIQALSVAVSGAGTEVKLEPALLQGDPEHEALVRRILDVCNRRERDVRLTPDGRILFMGLKASDLAGDRIDKSFVKLQEFLALIAGAAGTDFS